jgi:hypothetical protein
MPQQRGVKMKRRRVVKIKKSSPSQIRSNLCDRVEDDFASLDGDICVFLIVPAAKQGLLRCRYKNVHPGQLQDLVEAIQRTMKEDERLGALIRQLQDAAAAMERGAGRQWLQNFPCTTTTPPQTPSNTLPYVYRAADVASGTSQPQAAPPERPRT